TCRESHKRSWPRYAESIQLCEFTVMCWLVHIFQFLFQKQARARRVRTEGLLGRDQTVRIKLLDMTQHELELLEEVTATCHARPAHATFHIVFRMFCMCRSFFLSCVCIRIAVIIWRLMRRSQRRK